MTIDQYKQELWCLDYTAGMNQRYHQILESRWGIAEKAVRILTGVLAVSSLISSIPNLSPTWAAITIGIAGVISALSLNVLPLGDREKFHAELFRRWSDLKADIEVEAVKIERKLRTEKPGDAALERLEELIAKKAHLHASEPAAFEKLIRRCQEDENESRFGDRLRTYADVESERCRRLAASTSSQGSVSQEEAETREEATV